MFSPLRRMTFLRRSTKWKSPAALLPYDVAGMEPAAGPGALGRHLVLEVAEEEVGARVVAGGTHQQLAGHVDLGVVAAHVDDPRLDEEVGAAEAAGADVARLAVGHDAGGRAGLGHRPGLEQREAEAGLEGGMVARVDPGAEAEAQLVHPVALARRRRQQHRRHHAEVVRDRGAALAHALPPGARMEAVELDDDAAGEDRGHRRERERVHVVERQRRDEALDVGPHRRQIAEAEVPLAGAQEIAVGEAAALGLAGGPRGVEQGAFGAAADRSGASPRSGVRASGIRPATSGRIVSSSLLAELAASRRPLSRPGCTTASTISLWLIEVAPFGRTHVLVDRHDADAERVERQPVGEERRPVFEHQADAMPRTIAGARVGGAQPFDLASRPRARCAGRASMP